MNELIVRLLEKRGIAGPDAIEAFLSPTLDRLTGPFEIANLERACLRVRAAVERREKVFIYGDGDADGICAVFLLLKTFQATGTDISWYLTHRLEDYEIDENFVASLKDSGCSLLITVDCGISSGRALQRAARLGLEVIVLDHHLPGGADLPKEHIYVNPVMGGAPEAANWLTGAGVAFKFTQGLASVMPGLKEKRAAELVEIAGLGTAGDSAVLRGDNRILVREGMSCLATTVIPGLRRFLEYLDIPARCTYRHLQMKVNPKLNTPGRFGRPETALQLLLSEDEMEISGLIREIVALDRKRYTMTAQLLRDIEERPDVENGFVAAGRFPTSLCGIVASRLSEKRRMPVLVYACAGDAYQGSARSPSWFNLHGAMEPLKPFLSSFGGHIRAVGLTFSADNLESVRLGWDGVIARSRECVPNRTWDEYLDLDGLGPSLVRELARLEPFGPGNPRPVFRCAGVGLQNIFRRERDKMKFWVRKGESFYECEAAGGEDSVRLVPGGEAAIHYTPHIRENAGLYRIWLDVKYIE